jgi:hypothetical protein
MDQRRYSRDTVAYNPIVYPLDDGSVSTEHWWNDYKQGKTETIDNNLSQSRFIHHKSHVV